MMQGLRNLQTSMQAAEAVLSREAAATSSAETWSSAQVFRFKTRVEAVPSNVKVGGKLPIWQVMQQLSREIGQGNNRNGKQGAQDDPLAERWKLQSEGLSSQVASLRSQLAEARRSQDCLRNDLYDSMKREEALKAKLAAADIKLDAVERWALVLGQGMEEEVSRNFLESDKSQLQHLTECLALAVKSMQLFVGLMDKDSAGSLRYTFVHNQKQFFGDADMIGKRDDEIVAASIPGVREAMAIKQKTLETGVTATGEITLVLPEACTHWMITCEPRQGKNKEVIGVAFAAINITETVEGRARLAKLHTEIAARDAIEVELRRAIHLTEEAMKTKSMFLAIMSHEMRTPLNGVLGMAHVLNTTPLDEEQRELVDAMLASGDTLLAIVDDAVDVRKLESGEVSQHSQPFNPHQVVNQVLHMASAAVRGRPINFEADISSDIPKEILGDELRIRQVLTNLVHNSLKFTNSGFVRIGISVSETPPFEGSPQKTGAPRPPTLQSALSHADSCLSGLTIAGGGSVSEGLDKMLSSGDKMTSSGWKDRSTRRSLGTQGFSAWQVEQSEVREAEEEDGQPAMTPPSVLDLGLQDMDERKEAECGVRNKGGCEDVACEECGAAQGMAGTSSARCEASSERRGSGRSWRSGGEEPSEREIRLGGAGHDPVPRQHSDLRRSLSRQRSLDGQISWDGAPLVQKTPERLGRDMERLQRQNSRSSSGGRKRSPNLQRREGFWRTGVPPSEHGLQRENSLASISEGMLTFDEALGRVEQGLQRMKSIETLSRESSLDSACGEGATSRQDLAQGLAQGLAEGLERTSSLQRQASLSYITDELGIDVAECSRLGGLGRSASAFPEKVEGFGVSDKRKTASEHAFSRCDSFDEGSSEPTVWLRVSVQDSGCGIPEEAFPMLFEKFTQVDASTTRQYGGTGLGLAICKQLVENILSGKMEVESKLDEGSTFTFTVPCRKSTHISPYPPVEECSEDSSEQPAESARDPSCSVAGAGSQEDCLPDDEMVWRSGKEDGAATVEQPQFQGVDSMRIPPPPHVPSFGQGLAPGTLEKPPSQGVDSGRKRPPLEVPVFIPEDEEEQTSTSFAYPLPKPPSPSTNRCFTPPERTVSEPDPAKVKRLRQPGKKGVSVAPPLSPHLPKSLPPAPPPPDSPPSLLLVEDNNINVVVAQSMLRRLGLKADVAGNGVEAVQALCKTTYHLVMMDICMPRMDGLQATSAVRRFEESGEWCFDVEDNELQDLKASEPEDSVGCQQGIHVPIIAMTANAMDGDVDRCYSHGLDAFIAKPVSFEKLKSVLKHFLPWCKLELRGTKK